MKLTDLKLLVDCAAPDPWNKLHEVTVGFVAAKKRLVARGLIEENPQWLGCVRITDAGQRFVEEILSDHP